MAHGAESVVPASPGDASALPRDASAALVAPSLLTPPSNAKQQKAPAGCDTSQSCALEPAGTSHVAPPSRQLPPAALQELPAAWADGEADGEPDVAHEVAP